MARIKGAVNAKKKHKRVLKLAKGFYGQKSLVFRQANAQVNRALAEKFAGRKRKKREFRKLWIARINAAVREHGLSYSKFMHGLKSAGIDINRKILSEIAIYDEKGFKQLVEAAKSNIS